MSTIVRLVQGSAEWHDHRRKCRNASETAIVLGLSPWTTPYQLWQLKLGLVQQVVSPAMQRGTELEAVARAAYERQTGRVMQPLMVVDGEYSASLDGMTFGGERIVEIKAPFKGRDSTLWKTVDAGRLPEHYHVQVQHQLLVTGAAIADVYSQHFTRFVASSGARVRARCIATLPLCPSSPKAAAQRRDRPPCSRCASCWQRRQRRYVVEKLP
jgi:putative phage-type endonuclease